MFKKSAKYIVATSNTLLQWLAITLVRIYQLFFAFLFVGRCRFMPTCSAYAIEALRVHGGLVGLWLTIKRLCKCHPFAYGGVDFVPEKSHKG